MKAKDRQKAALKRGADDLQSCPEYLLRNRPRSLKFARERYVRFAVLLFRAIEKAS
jgi:hypothetical protein